MWRKQNARAETKLTALDSWLVGIDELPFYELDDEGRLSYNVERKR